MYAPGDRPATPVPPPPPAPAPVPAPAPAHGVTWKPTTLGLVAAISVGVLLLITVVRPFVFLVGRDGHLHGLLGVVFTGFAVVTFLAAAAPFVLGLLGFRASGRRDLVAFGSAAIGAYAVVQVIVSTVLNFAAFLPPAM